MYDGSKTLAPGDYLVKSDLSEFAKMTKAEKNFARPFSLKVCSNDERIFGLQLTLEMFRPVFPNEDEIVE